MSKLVVALLIIIVAAVIIIYLAYIFWGPAAETGGGLKPENLLIAPKFLISRGVIK